jgi:hypothetical protein
MPEGSTTIPKGSTIKRLETGASSYITLDEDIVYSAWKHVAAKAVKT